MSRLEAWCHHLANAIVIVSGVLYGWMLYFAEPADEFSVLQHPWQAEVQRVHILAAPAVVFLSGLIWRAHVWARIQLDHPHRRRTGIVLAVLLLPMTLSGYVLQVVTDETWMRIWVVLHVTTSGLWIVTYIVHQFSARGESEELFD